VPTEMEIKKGLKRGTIDYEARPNRADVSVKRKVKLEDGGEIAKRIRDNIKDLPEKDLGDAEANKNWNDIRESRKTIKAMSDVELLKEVQKGMDGKLINQAIYESYFGMDITAKDITKEIESLLSKESAAKKRLEELRKELRAERISYEEIAELQSLSKYIDKGDVELLEAAGIDEFKKGGKTKEKWIQDALAGKKGVLRSTAKKKGLLRGDENLSKTDLKKLQKMGGKTAKRAHLSETLSKFKKGGKVGYSDEDKARFAKPAGWRWKEEAFKKGFITRTQLAQKPSKYMRDKYPTMVYYEDRLNKSDKKPTRTSAPSV
jgi:hypothetical protein